jgi:hypothetical protein
MPVFHYQPAILVCRMGFLGLVISSVAIWFLWDNGWAWILLGIFVTAVEFWSWGIMHNHATDAAKKRDGYSGGFYDLTPEEANSVPNWLAMVNLGGFVVAVGLLILVLWPKEFLDNYKQVVNNKGGIEPRPELSPYGVRAERLGWGFTLAKTERNLRDP